MSDSDEAAPWERAGATSGVQQIRPLTPTLGARLLRLSAEVRSSDDEADLLDHYFTLFAEIDPTALWVVHLLSDTGVRLVRASARLPDAATHEVAVARESILDSGLDTLDHPALRIVENYEPLRSEPLRRDGFQTLLMDGDTLLGVLGCEPEEQSEALAESVRLIAATLSPHASRIRGVPARLGLNNYLVDLIRRADVPLLLLDGHGDAAVASSSFLQLVERTHVRGERWSEFIAPADHERMRRALSTMQPVECDLVSETSSVRAAFDLMSLTHPALGGAGTLLIGRDLRDLQALEEQVIQSEKLATLGQLAAGVVHELNNPLTSIVAYSQYLMEITPSERPEKEDELIRRIVENSQRMRRFTQNLGAYARPAKGPPTRVDVGNLLDESLGFCEHIVREVDARVRVDLPDDFPGALGIRASLQQVFVNLITNACHATGRGGQLRLAAYLDRDSVAIIVEDDGPGVADSDQERIFEPFFTTKGEGQGTGLGLSIVRNILTLQNGTIHLEQRSRGARFIVRLPIYEGAPD